ncbi:hypothetical protein D5086_005310 [Populus alba]|uniref:Uncharacterized protein n=1 Tax=Populus alba TaxID=43335 RepID=A0ACC4CU70_POPAL
MGRAPCCEKVGLKKGRWTAEEDEKLAKYIQANGEGSWRSLPKNAALESPFINVQWSLIASYLPGRTDNEIKNYWNSHLSRRIHSFRRSASESLPLIMETAKGGVLTIGKGGRAGRFAVKKNKNSRTPKDVTRAPSIKKPLMENNTSNCHNSNIEVMQLLQTPAIEKETLSSAINDTVIWDPCEDDKEQMDLVMPSPYPETGRGMVGSSGEKATLVVSHSDEITSGNSMLCPSVGEIDNDSSGPFYQGIEKTLCFDEFTDKELLDPNGGSTLNEERQDGLVVHSEERENGVLSPNKTVYDSIDYLSSNGESGEWHSCSSISRSGFDDWIWDDVMGGHVQGGGDEIQEDNMLSWLWESDQVEWGGRSTGL